jgi:hypothetical protein
MPEDSPKTIGFHHHWAVMAALVALLASLRFCHVRLLWSDEDYHLAAALNLLHGKLPYRDFWYDKPPLSAFYYLVIQGHSGIALRFLDTAYVLIACFFAYRVAKQWWGEAEGRMAAILLAFFLAFYVPAAVIGFAADALMLVPHLAAIYYVLAKRPVVAGVCCAVAFLVNVKGLLILAVCLLWLPAMSLLILLGFVAPIALSLALASTFGMLQGYWQQVWRWGWLYASQSPLSNPLLSGLNRTAGWLGFHGALTLGSVITVRFDPPSRWKAISWISLSFLGVCLGGRFAPHYYVQLLAPLVVVGARGLMLAWQRWRLPAKAIAALLLLIPAVRFGSKYPVLAYDTLTNAPVTWRDAALDLDSQHAAQKINELARPGDSLFVWGYRPSIYVYTRLVSDGKFWDSQPLTGVPADRHLQASRPIHFEAAAQNRRAFLQTHPVWLVDGLGPLNPELAPSQFSDLKPWLSQYEEVARTHLSVIYRRR